MIKVRLARMSDFDQISRLLAQLNPSDPELSDFELKIFRDIIDSDNLDIIVADEKDTLVGSVYFNLIPNLTRGGRSYAVIENVITDVLNRNRGIGKALLNEALKLAQQRNCYKVMLMSGRRDGAVHEFYKKCGFDPLEKQAYVKRIA